MCDLECVCVGVFCACASYIYTSAKIPKTQILKKHLLLFAGSRDEGGKGETTPAHTLGDQLNAGHRLPLVLVGLVKTRRCVSSQA